MSDKTANAVHWSFWVIATITLIWNAMGAMNFIMQMNPDAVANYPESHRAIIDGRPLWATAGFAVAVFGGAAGCFLLLFRKSSAFYLFIASLLGVIVTMIHTLDVVDSAKIFSPFELVMMILMPLLVAAFLIWYSKYAEGKNWIS